MRDGYYIKSALYNLQEGMSSDYARGIFVGVVSTIMDERKVELAEAIQIVKPYMPSLILPGAIPQGWEDLL